MKWQDVAATVVGLVFIGSLLPSVFSEHKPAFSTSVMTASGLAVFVAVYLSYRLWYATVTELVTVALWAILAWQVRPSKR
jgi:hypothetical protein